MTSNFTHSDIKQKVVLLLGYTAYFTCGISIAVYKFQVIFRQVGDDLVAPYIVTILLVGAVGIIGVILTFIQRDIFLVFLTALTIGLMIFWRLAEGSLYLEIYSLIYALITIATPFISWYFVRRRKVKYRQF